MITALRNEFWRILLAVQFLTRIPAAPHSAFSEQRFSESVRHYPLVGLLIGAIAAAIFFAAGFVFPPLIALLISTSLVILLTGAFHEDGLADTFDGIGGGLTGEKSLQIMKDSRIGVFGMVALLAILTIKIAALNSMPVDLAMLGLLGGHCMSRWSSVVAIASSTYVRDSGTAKPVAAGISGPALFYASVVGLSPLLAFYYCVTPIVAAGAAAGLLLGHLFMRLFYERKIGGYTGDCLGAVQQVSELGVYLGILACL